MKRNYLFIPIFFLMGIAVGYSQQWKWAKNGGSNLNDEGGGVAVDKGHNIYSTGDFMGTFAVGSSSLLSAGGQDILLAKYDSAGNFIWAKQAGGLADDYGNFVAIDDSANVYVSGAIGGDAIFDNDTLHSLGLADAFLAKYDSSGNLKWLKRFGGSGDDGCGVVKVDKAGNIIIGGWFSDTASFGIYSAICAGQRDGFLMKCTPSGNVTWLATGGGAESDCFTGISVDVSNDILCSGFFQQTATFSSQTLTAIGFFVPTLFIAKYSSIGNILWIKQAGGNVIYGNSVDTDSANNCYVGGYFRGTASFDTTSVTSSGQEDIFLAKYDGNGNRKWTRKIGGTSFDGCFSIATNQQADIFMSGYFQSAGTALGQPKGSTDIFILKYDSSGNFKWSKTAGSSGLDYGYVLVLDFPNNIYLSGYFTNVCHFDNDSTITNGGRDFYLAKMLDTAGVLSSANEIPEEIFSVNVFPNPSFSTTIFFLSQEGIYQLKIFDVTGKLIESKKFSGKKFAYENSFLENGIYFYEIRNERNEFTCGKFIRQNE